MRAFASRSDDAQSSSVSSIDMPLIHPLPTTRERSEHLIKITTVVLGSVEVQLFPLRIPCFEFPMDRYVLTDAQWARMEPHCRGKKSDPGRSGADNRRFVEAVLWIARTGSPWRDLPALFGHWNTIFKRYRDWVKANIFKRLFDAASDEPDMEYAMVDATIVKVHRHGQGAKGGLRARPSADPRAA
jgi:transposase